MIHSENIPPICHYTLNRPDSWCSIRRTAPDAVDLYEIHLPAFIQDTDRFYSYLSVEEKKRVDDMYDQNRRSFFIVSNGFRRVILSRYISITPAEIQFRTNQYGKPFISNQNPDGVTFNTSHSHEKLLFGICKNRDIGVDIQFESDNFPEMKIANRVFGSVDSSYLAKFSGDELRHEFFRIWSLKEAYCKALGLGFSLPVENMPVMSDLCDGEGTFSSQGSEWYAYRIQVQRDYQASVIVRTSSESLIPSDEGKEV